MKATKITTKWIMALALVTCFASTNAMAKSSESLEYEQAHQRGTQALIWGLPAVSMKGFYKGMQAVGADYGDIVYWSKPMVSRHHRWVQQTDRCAHRGDQDNLRHLARPVLRRRRASILGPTLVDISLTSGSISTTFRKG